MAMPQAMVLSGRKCPPSRSVAAPRIVGGEAGQHQREQQSEPRRAALHRRVPGGRIGADADERGLAERRQPADAGEQHQAERDKRIDADVVHQRDGEGAEQSRRDRDEGDGDTQQDVGAANASGVPLAVFVLDLFLDLRRAT